MSSDDEGSWAPFGPAGDDDPPPAATEPSPPAEPVDEPEPEPAPVEEPSPVDEPPPVSFEPPAAPATPPPTMNWPPPAPPAPAPPPVSQWQGAPPPAYGTPRQMASNAVASLVLGIVGLVVCPLIASVAAIATGSSAKRQIRENPQLGGGAQATWGVALGWIGVAWGLFIILAAVLGAASGST